MRVDVLVAEIGSTTTVVNAFDGLEAEPRFIAQGAAPTSVLEGDVTIGLSGAIADLQRNLEAGELEWGAMYASSSAAGGLKMTVHGLVYDMTVRAAKEAALGAGAVLRYLTAGDLTDHDLESIKRIGPNIILLAGGVDYGERATVVANARRLASLGPLAPVIYAGNVAARHEAEAILADAGYRVFAVENVYPRIDELNIEPTRRVIQRVFEEHIIHAPGMDKIRELVTGTITPTPGAVMSAARLLKEDIGDLMVLDVGGATTDVHSVTEGSDEISRLLVSPEPTAKRTVEGDLGVFINARNIAELVGWEQLEEAVPGGRDLFDQLKPIPDTPGLVELVVYLTGVAVETAVRRHAGRLKHLYGPTGRVTVAEGKDLSKVRWIIGTGGALTRLPGGREIMERLKRPQRGGELFPGADAQVLLDHDYILASLGVLGANHPAAAVALIRKSLRLEG
ncbi:MAG: GlmL-related ornithine degradation protein [Bacillota bacterium]